MEDELSKANSVSRIILDRCQGALLGLAVGDALGTTLEFRPPGRFSPISDLVGGGPFELDPGQWTDDTSMALCLADSLLACRAFDARDQMSRYIRWWRDGENSSTGVCFDIGCTTSDSLARFEATDDPLAGPTDPYTAGNGSLMRLAPVAIWTHAADIGRAARCYGDSSRTTHGARAAVDACRVMGVMLCRLINGATRDELLQPDFFEQEWPGNAAYWQSEPACEEIAAILRDQTYRTSNPPDIKASGYVVKTFEAALWAWDRTDTFRDGALQAVNLGDDADTVGAVYGQLAGACYGLSGIPKDWVRKIHHGARIGGLARELAFASRETAADLSAE